MHAFAHNFGARYHIPHGKANAILLPYVLEYSKHASRSRLAELARIAGVGEQSASEAALADAFIAHIRDLNQRFGIPARVDELDAADIPTIATNARSEANWFYAVPLYMDRDTSERFLKQLLPA